MLQAALILSELLMNASQNIYHPLVPAIMGYARKNGINGDFSTGFPTGISQPTDLLKLGLTQNQLQKLGANITDLSNEPCPGLHIGEKLHWANLGIVGYIVVNSPNVLEGLKKFQAYYQMVSNITRFKLVERSDTIELCWQPIDNKVKIHHRLILDGVLGSLCPLIEQQTGLSIAPREIQFCWPAPGDLTEYERAFGSRLSFNESYIKAVFDRSVGEIPCQLPNAELLDVLENHVRDRCHQTRTDNPHCGEVLNILKRNNGNILGIEQVAESLGTSVRNLQIRLRKEGTTYRALRDQALCDQAQLLLGNSPESVEEISHRLGYSDPAVFYRNFKRWTGQTPGEFRSSSQV